MDILRNLQRLESNLARTVDQATRKVTQPGVREPLEVLHAIVAAAEKRIEPAGRGKYVFPFNQINVSIAADSDEALARFQAVLESEPSLGDRILERLAAARCELTDLSIVTTYVESAEEHWAAREFHVAFARLPNALQAEAKSEIQDHRLTLTVVAGGAEKAEYEFCTSRINLGRGTEVRDNRGRLLRTNDVAFSDSSVSRNHAHIDCATLAGEYRLYDDRSSHGTAVVRKGVTVPVPPGPRGIRLRPGDEIALGDVRLRVGIDLRRPQDSTQRI